MKNLLSEFIRHEWSESGSSRSPSSGGPLQSLQSLRREFSKMDLDGDGRISKQEFIRVVEAAYENERKMHPTSQ